MRLLRRKRPAAGWALAVGLLCAATGDARAAPITFDDLAGGGPSDVQITAPYAGFTWANTYVLDVPLYLSQVGTSGCSNGLAQITAPNVGFSGFGNAVAFAAPVPFALLGMTLGAGWYDNMQVVVTGLRLGSVVHTANFTLSASVAPTTASFNWSNIDRVEIAPVTETGTPVGYPAGGGQQVYFDTIAVPEPASLALMCVGLAGLGLARCRLAPAPRRDDAGPPRSGGRPHPPPPIPMSA